MIFFTPYDKIAGAFLGRLPEDLGEEFFQVDQVHGDAIATIRDFGEAKALKGRKADAIITTAWAVPIAIRTADCVPILLAHPDRVVAAVHAGWRGTQAGILAKTIQTMEREFKADPAEIFAAIGPSICGPCYEVGKEVAEHFIPAPDSKICRPRPGGERFELDLKAANAAQALAAGLRPENLEIHPECTRCREDLLHSHRGALARGEAQAGRNYSWVMIAP
ncbi:MAG TPA: peptidoglycan editing factor PgeF [bacterium]|nr:peptidoglycan editing factor PgeF [bacterium]